MSVLNRTLDNTYMKKKKLLLWMFLVTFSFSAVAKEIPEEKHSFAIYVGYGNMVNGVGTLTNTHSDYKKKFREGIIWNAEYYFRLVKFMGVGFLYSGYSAKGNHAEGADHIYTHYMAPQIGVYCLNKEKVQLRLNVGMGGIRFLNNSEVFDKSRRVTGSRFAFNVGTNAVYKLTDHWGVSLDVQYIGANLHKVDSKYHGETIIVRYPEGKRPSMSRLNVSGGIAYHF